MKQAGAGLGRDRGAARGWGAPGPGPSPGVSSGTRADVAVTQGLTQSRHGPVNCSGGGRLGTRGCVP